MIMADSDWETAPQGASSLQAKMLANDAYLQAQHPDWPTGGTAQQLKQESNYNPNAVSPKGAQGMVQAMPDTKAAVEQQMGRKLDFNNVNDQLAFHRYLMNQNLERSGGDPSGALSLYNSGKLNANNPETNNYVANFNKALPPKQASDDSGWESAPAQTAPVASSDAGWESAPKAQPSVKQQAIQTQLQQMGPDVQAMGAGMTGAGEALVQQATGGAGMVAGGLKSLVDLATGRSANATSDIANIEKALTFQPRTPEGQAISAKISEGFGKIVDAMKIGAQTTLGPLGVPKEVSDTAAEVVANIAPMIMGMRAPIKGAEVIGKPVEAGAAASELDKLNTANAPEQPQAPAGPTAEQQFATTPTPYRQYFQQPSLLEGAEGIQPEGPTLAGSTAAEAFPVEGARGALSNRRQMELDLNVNPPITIDAAGNAMINGQPASSEMLAAEIGRRRQQATEQQAAGTLFPETLRDTTGQASSYNPNLEAGISPFDVNQMRGQGRLQLDPMQDRMQAMREASADQLDMFNPIDQRTFDQFGENETPRSLSPDEFGETIRNLAEKDGTRFPMPEDMEAAYSRYLDTVRDDQGGLFDRPTIAKNFVEAAVDEALDRRVAEHPVVKANQDRVDMLAAQDLSVPSAKQALQQAERTLEKSQNNIRNFFKPVEEAAAPKVGPDGAVNMYTFGHLPEMFKSIGAILRALHGVVFKTLDRAIPTIRNLDSGPKIFAQGIKDFVNNQAKKEWSQTVNEKPMAQLNKIEALRKGIAEYNPYEAQEISPAELKQQMLDAPDISGGMSAKLAQNIAQGGLQLTNLTRNPLVKYVTESVDRAARNSREYVKTALTGPDGLRTRMQALSDHELTGVRSLMEMNEGKKEFNENELRHSGFSQKQIDYYNRSMELQKEALAKHNEARAQAGMKPLDARVGHIAGYFMGDFRQLVTDADGKVKAVLAHNYREGLKTIAKRYMDDHGTAAGYKLEPIKLNKLSESLGASDNRFHGYMEILNTLKDTNADVKAVVDAYQNYMVKDAQSAMANRAKFKQSEGVIGAEGRKAWQSAQKNAVDGARQQLKYLESLDKWSEMQKAIQKTKGFLGDEEISTKSPNAVNLAQDYLDSVQGRNRGPMQKLLNSLLNTTAQVTGVGPSVFKGANNATKSVMLAKFVGIFKLSHSAVTLLQPMQAIPTINARISARGADLGAASLTSVGKAMTSAFNITKNETMGGDLSKFDRNAQAFMVKNGTTDVGMSSHLANVTKGSAKSEALRHVAELNVRIPEQGARAFTFMYYSHMLNDLGLPEAEVFPTAHNLMREAMVDYSPHERSLMFGKMGLLGDIASTLTRFKYNQIGQHLIGAADWARGGSIAPLMTTVLASAVAGGLRGVFGYEAANYAIDKISTELAKLGIIKEPTSLNEMVLHMVHGMGHAGDLLNFGAPAALGVNMTGSLTNADSIPVDPLGALFPTASEFSNLAKASGTFLTHPNRNTASQAALQLSPNSMKGMLEDALFTKNGEYTNPATGKLDYTRTPSDEILRALSFRPLGEGKEGLEANVANRKSEQLDEVKQTVLKHAYSDMISNNMKLSPDQAQKYAQRYISLGSDPQSFVNELVQFAGMDQARDRLQRQAGIPGKDLESVLKYQRAQGLK